MVAGTAKPVGKFARATWRTVKKPHFMTPEEKRIAREMHFDRGMKPNKVAIALGRDLSCICRLLKQKKAFRIPSLRGKF